MLGAIAGDIIGSVYEWNNIKTKEFPLISPDCFFTDDSVLTIALAEAILTGEPYDRKLRQYYHAYPDRGYGGSFKQWAETPEAEPYNSWGNGAAMRISPAGFIATNIHEVFRLAEQYTAVTHNHPEGIKGAQATAAAIYLARTGRSKAEIAAYVRTTFSYDLSRHVDEIRPDYTFDVSCQGTVPQAIRAFLDSTDYEDAIRTAISLGGDSDTLACITGGIAQAFYGEIPSAVEELVYAVLDEPLAQVVRAFVERFPE